MLQIRSIALSILIEKDNCLSQIEHACIKLINTKKFYLKSDINVQTTRLICKGKKHNLLDSFTQEVLNIIDKYCENFGIDFFCIEVEGKLCNINKIKFVIKNSRSIICSIDHSHNELDYKYYQELSNLIIEYSKIDESSILNLRLCLLYNSQKGGALIPGATVSQNYSFTVGIENSRLFKGLFPISNKDDKLCLSRAIKIYKIIQEISLSFAQQEGLHFGGIDSSILSSINGNCSVVDIFKDDIVKLGNYSCLCSFYSHLQINKIKLCGQMGIRLNSLEDKRLSNYFNNSEINFREYLLLSLTIGSGIDVLLVPKQVNICGLLMDLDAICIIHRKTFFLRIIPCVNYSSGDIISFDCGFYPQKIMQF